MRISDWSSDVCSSDLLEFVHAAQAPAFAGARRVHFRANTASTAATPARGPSGWPHTAPLTARKSAPAFTSGAAFSAVMPPMATQGSSNSAVHQPRIDRSEEHTSELQSLMRISYAVFCLKKKTHKEQHNT